MKMRFKTIKALKKELGIREEYSGILVFKGQDYGIINEMLWLFNGEEHEVEILGNGPVGYMEIFIRSSGDTYHFHKNWIDNSPQVCYNDIDTLFKEPL
jgi:hypothetical protein